MLLRLCCCLVNCGLLSLSIDCLEFVVIIVESLFNEKVKANLKQIALNNNKSVDLAHIRDILLPKLMAGDLTLSVGC